MQEGSKNSFTGGLNKDSAEELVQPTQYRDARNGRLVSRDGNTAEFQNMRGDTVAFSLPNLPQICWKYETLFSVEGSSSDLEQSLDFLINLSQTNIGSSTWTTDTRSYTLLAPSTPNWADAQRAEIESMVGNDGTVTIIELSTNGSFNRTVHFVIDFANPLVTSIIVPATGFLGSPVVSGQPVFNGFGSFATYWFSPAVDDLKIIGHGADEKDLILFTTSRQNVFPKYIGSFEVTGFPSGWVPGAFITITIRGITSYDIDFSPNQTDSRAFSGTLEEYAELVLGLLNAGINNIPDTGDQILFRREGAVIYVEVDAGYLENRQQGNTSFEIDITSNFAFTPAISGGILTVPLLRDTNTYGQVWKVDISKNNEYNTRIAGGTRPLSIPETLLYSNTIDFSLINQIYDAEIVREGNGVARVYWTDNFNPPRVLSIIDGFLTLEPRTIDLSPISIGANINYIETIDGELDTAYYKVSYQYVDTQGGTTPWQQLSSPINIYGDNDETYRFSVGFAADVGSPSSKGFVIGIENIDEAYDIIRLAVCKWTVAGDVPPTQVWIADERDITGTTAVFTVRDNEENYEPLTYEDIQLINPSISRAKNLKVVGNNLILSNIDEADTINFDGSTVVFSGVATPNPGQNVLLDDQVEIPPPGKDFSGQRWFGHDRITSTDGADVGLGKGVADDFVDGKGAPVPYYYKGYYPGEVYRFGITFQLNDGSWTRVAHLGDYALDDLRLQDGSYVPIADELCTAPTYDGTSVDDLLVRINGFQFTNIDVSSFKDKIRGFSIVRAKRDPITLAHGVLMPMCLYEIFTNVGSIGYIAIPEYFDVISPTDTLGGASSLAGFRRQMVWKGSKTLIFHSPELDAPGGNELLAQAEKVELLGYLSKQVGSNSAEDWTVFVDRNGTVGNNHQNGNIFKFYGKQSSPVGLSTNVFNNGGNPDVPLAIPGTETDITHTFALGFNQGPYQDPTSSYEFKSQADSTTEQIWGPRIFHSQDAELESTTPQRLWVRIADTGRKVVLNTVDNIHLPIMGNSTLSSGARYNAVGYAALKNGKTRDQLYGGISDSALETTVYYATGHYQPVDDNNPGASGVYSADVFGGDCYTQIYHKKLWYNNEAVYTDTNTGTFGAQDAGLNTNTGLGIAFPVHTTINLAHREGAGNLDAPSLSSPQPSFGLDSANGVVAESGVRVEPIWSNDVSGSRYIGGLKPKESEDSFSLVTAMQGSKKKVNGEAIDSFRIFPVNDRVELEYNLGGINHTDTLASVDSNRLYFFMNRAFGFVPINERVVIGDAAQAVIGSGTLFGEPQYIRRGIGTFHKGSVTKSPRALYFFDLSSLSFYRFAQDGVSDLSGDKSISSLTADKNDVWYRVGVSDNTLYLGGIHAGYNEEFNEVFFTGVLRGGLTRETVIYSEDMSAFVSLCDIQPDMYMPVWSERFLSPKPVLYTSSDREVVYEHFSGSNYNHFYDSETANYTEIQFVVANKYELVKVLSYMEYIANRRWDDYSILSGEQAMWDAESIRHQTNGDFNLFQPRGKRWQGTINRVKSSYKENPDGSIDTAIGNYVLQKMHGNYFLVKLRTNAGTLRGLLEVITMFSISKRNR